MAVCTDLLNPASTPTLHMTDSIYSAMVEDTGLDLVPTAQSTYLFVHCALRIATEKERYNNIYREGMSP